MGLFSKARQAPAEPHSADVATGTVDTTTPPDDRALDTLAGILRCYGSRGFDIESMTAHELERRCEGWIRHITTGTPAPLCEDEAEQDNEQVKAAPVSMDRRQWADLQQFFRNHRHEEQSAVTGRAEGMRGLIGEMTNGLRNAISDDNAKDELVTRELVSLSATVESNSLEAIRIQLAKTVDVVSQVVHERQARYEAQLKLMSERVHNLRADLVALREKVDFDSLTRLHNRGAFDDVLAKQIDFSFLSGQPMALIMIDLDHFKQINDTYGHPGGDAVLREVAKTLFKLFPRRSDFIARYGGEEFALILVDAEPHDVERLGERVLHAVRTLEVEYLDNHITATCSVGIATCTFQDSAETLVRRADQALYQAKNAGRDRLMVAG
ncbi:MAG: diguanylate cyclase [Gammaproteobacteria bacterium]|nr:diguanylate cyclase [Gammaproteobacteria bacterium]